jgi:hypothetical protein
VYEFYVNVVNVEVVVIVVVYDFHIDVAKVVAAAVVVYDFC